MAINDNKVFWKRHIGNTRGHYVERDLKKKKAIGGTEMLNVEGVRYNVRGHQGH
jgi:hypothetical protein